jgi:hypothetical protein
MCFLLTDARPAGEAPDLKQIIAALPDIADYPDKEIGSGSDAYTDPHPGLADALDALMPRLRELSYDCPACLLAAMRQKHIPVHFAQQFNYRKEAKSIRDEYYENKNGVEEYCY